MTTGFSVLDAVLAAVVFAGIFYWMYALTSRSHAQRLEQRRAKAQRNPR